VKYSTRYRLVWRDDSVFFGSADLLFAAFLDVGFLRGFAAGGGSADLLFAAFLDVGFLQGFAAGGSSSSNLFGFL